VFLTGNAADLTGWGNFTREYKSQSLWRNELIYACSTSVH